MASNIDALLPSAKDYMQKLAAAEAEEAAKIARKAAEAEKEKQALHEHFTNPSGVSDEEGVRRAVVMIERAVRDGRTEVQVYVFPSELCTDRGRAINQQEPGWEKTLTGLPKEVYDFWERCMRPLGYKIKFQIVSFPGGMPGDVGITLKWG